MKQNIEQTGGQSSIQKGLNVVVDHFRLMGVIAKESIMHPRIPTTIIYDSATREITVDTKLPDAPPNP